MRRPPYPSSPSVDVASTSTIDHEQRQHSARRMARLARYPKSKPALVPIKETCEDTHVDRIQTECERIVDHFRELTYEKHRVWPRFKELESTFVNTPTSTLDPTTLRSYIPDEIISILLAASPDDEFTITNSRYVAKVRKAATFWNVDPKHLLFQTAFDYGKQGEGFFSALYALAKADNDWPRCRSALRACVLERRQLQVLPNISRRGNSLSYRKGIIESDVRTVISRVAPPPTPRPASPPPQPQVVPEPPSTPTKATEQVAPKTGDDPAEVTESTPEKGRKAGHRQPPSPIFTSPARSPIQSSPSSPVPLAEKSQSQDKQPDAVDDWVVNDFDADSLVSDGDLPNDLLIDDSFHIGASGARNDNPISNDSQNHPPEVIDEGKAHITTEGTVSNTSATSDQQSTPTQHKTAEEQQKMSPAAKRPRLDAALSGSVDDAQQIIKEDWWITDQQLMQAIGPMCDTVRSGADGVMVVESLETQKMVQPNYVSCRTILCRLPKVSLILLPLHLGNNHWALATISTRQYAASSMKYFDSLPSDGRMEQARDLILAFVKHYLWDTPPRARIVVPCASPRQTNGSDCGVFTFAAALFKATNHDLPAHLDSRLWRSIMAGCLHKESSSDLSSLVPKPTPNASTPEALPSSTLSLPQRMKALSKEYKRIKAVHANDLKQCTSVLCDASLAIQVLDDVADSMTSNIEDLEGKLKAAKILERTTGLDSKATPNRSSEMSYDLPSAIRLTALVERARGARECTDATLLAITKLRDDTQRAYDELEDTSKDVGEEDSIALE